MKLPKVRQYPKTINIRGEIWHIKFVRKVDPQDETVGECDPGDRIIKIKLRQSSEDTLKTFIHEVIHAIEAEWDFDLPHSPKNDIVDKLENGLYAFILSNEFLWASPSKSNQ